MVQNGYESFTLDKQDKHLLHGIYAMKDTKPNYIGEIYYRSYHVEYDKLSGSPVKVIPVSQFVKLNLKTPYYLHWRNSSADTEFQDAQLYNSASWSDEQFDYHKLTMIGGISNIMEFTVKHPRYNTQDVELIDSKKIFSKPEGMHELDIISPIELPDSKSIFVVGQRSAYSNKVNPIINIFDSTESISIQKDTNTNTDNVSTVSVEIPEPGYKVNVVKSSVGPYDTEYDSTIGLYVDVSPEISNQYGSEYYFIPLKEMSGTNYKFGLGTPIKINHKMNHLTEYAQYQTNKNMHLTLGSINTQGLEKVASLDYSIIENGNNANPEKFEDKLNNCSPIGIIYGGIPIDTSSEQVSARDASARNPVIIQGDESQVNMLSNTLSLGGVFASAPVGGIASNIATKFIQGYGAALNFESNKEFSEKVTQTETTSLKQTHEVGKFTNDFSTGILMCSSLNVQYDTFSVTSQNQNIHFENGPEIEAKYFMLYTKPSLQNYFFKLTDPEYIWNQDTRAWVKSKFLKGLKSAPATNDIQGWKAFKPLDIDVMVKEGKVKKSAREMPFNSSSTTEVVATSQFDKESVYTEKSKFSFTIPFIGTSSREKSLSNSVKQSDKAVWTFKLNPYSTSSSYSGDVVLLQPTDKAKDNELFWLSDRMKAAGSLPWVAYFRINS
ncbi:hypothetical protein OAO18_03730 [Francisellaceae bacterium]|nr:hypothetical protein [Francisellaceae bacterium]